MEYLRMTMAQALVRFLDQQYVEVDGSEYKYVAGVWGIFGHGNATGIGEALEHGYSTLPFLQAQNEQAMVHTAVAYTKQLNRRQVFCCTTSIGPGALNMVTGAAVATVNRLPVLLLPGDIFSDRQPDPVLQQVEVPSDGTLSVNDCFKPVSRYWDRITRPEQIMAALIRTMQVLTDPEQMGAVTLCLPQDVQAESFDYPSAFFARRVYHIDRRPPDPRALEQAVSVIGSARRPLLVAGGGALYSGANQAIAELAEACEIPVVETQAGKGCLLWDNPWNLGGIGVTGSQVANRAAHQADVIVAVGSRLTDFTTASKTAFASDARIVQINTSGMDAFKMGAIPVLGDAAVTLQALTNGLRRREYRAAWDRSWLASEARAWQVEVDRLYRDEREEGLSQTAALGVINAHIEPDAVVVGAAGGLPGDLHRLWRVRSPKAYHLEYGFSCMGYEIAGALGAKLAEPERPVYALVGDGSYLMLNTALVTSLQLGVKITVVVFNNHGYQCIEELQKAHGSEGFGNVFHYASDPPSGYLPLDLAVHARSLGAHGIQAHDASELRAAMDEARSVPRSVVIALDVLPGTGTHGYDSWWRVATADTSRSPAVAEASSASRLKQQQARSW